MSIAFLNATVNDGESYTFTFASKVSGVTAVVQGFNVLYSGDDHHIKSIDVNAAVSSVSGTQVVVTATCEIRDNASNIGTGTVNIACIAELE